MVWEWCVRWGLVLSLLAFVAAPALPATAVSTRQAAAAPAAPPEAAPPREDSPLPFALRADYDLDRDVVDALARRLPTAPLSEVADGANIKVTACDGAPLPALKVSSICWGGARAGESDRATCHRVPQGIATSRDAYGQTLGAAEMLIVSWYHSDVCKKPATRSMITLMNLGADKAGRPVGTSYRKILLVEPTGTPDAPSFRDIPIHAGGIAWYGRYLYVADTVRGIRVFDLTRILRVNDGRVDGIGSRDGKTFRAHKHLYALPQTGMLTDSGLTRLRWSTIGLDRASPPSLVGAEFRRQVGKEPPLTNAVRYPLDPRTDQVLTTAGVALPSQRLVVPFPSIQGVVSHGGRWWFASSHGPDRRVFVWPGPGRPAWYFPWVASCEGLSYWEDAVGHDLIWGLSERSKRRAIFSVRQSDYNGPP